jgi:hypothetical protein
MQRTVFDNTSLFSVLFSPDQTPVLTLPSAMGMLVRHLYIHEHPPTLLIWTLEAACTSKILATLPTSTH